MDFPKLRRINAIVERDRADAITRLVETSEYLIDVRGYDVWEI